MAKRLVVTIAFLLMLPSRGWAAACAAGTLADYIAAGACTIGDKTFSNFTYAGSGFGGATAIPASGVAVVPQIIGGEIGLLFSAAWSVGPGQGLDSSIGYTVTAAPGNSIVDAVVTMSGFGHTPGGVVAVSETMDNGAHLFVHDDGGTVSSATVTFPPVSSITTLKNISVNGNAGVAALSAVSNLFSQSPMQPPTAT